jgi:uncharacterized membrane protein YgaE (UPF0421/DUF939 family)
VQQDTPQQSRLPIRLDRGRIWHTLRTALAATASLLLATACRLPEPYWAVITTVIVMQSTLGAAGRVSVQRLLGTLIGGIAAATIVTFPGPAAMIFALGMLAIALLCALVRLDDSAYRFAGVTLAIIMLPQHREPIWVVALYRFAEVSFGIVVGMAVSALWPEPEQPASRALEKQPPSTTDQPCNHSRQ